MYESGMTDSCAGVLINPLEALAQTNPLDLSFCFERCGSFAFCHGKTILNSFEMKVQWVGGKVGECGAGSQN